MQKNAEIPENYTFYKLQNMHRSAIKTVWTYVVRSRHVYIITQYNLFNFI
jgi:hypothetical protein